MNETEIKGNNDYQTDRDDPFFPAGEIMEYNDFSGRLEAELKKRFPAHYQIKRDYLWKNGTEREMLTAIDPDTNIAPVVYLDDLFLGYRNLDISFSDVVDQTYLLLIDAKKHLPQYPKFTKENAKKSLHCIVINYEENKEYLNKVPHERMEDLALVPKWQISTSAAMEVTHEICSYLQITDHEMMELAKENTKNQSFQIRSMKDVMCSILLEKETPEDYIEEFRDYSQPDIYVIDSPTHAYGAAAIINKKALKEVSEKLGADYYILPSSIHELLAIKKEETELDTLRDMVFDINRNVVDARDYLSDTIYEYSRQTNCVTAAKIHKKQTTVAENLPHRMPTKQ